MTGSAGYRHTDGTHEVRWQPDDSQAARDALVAVDGTGVSASDELPDDGLVDLTDQLAVRAAVRKEFDRLTTDSSGGSTSGQ